MTTLLPRTCLRSALTSQANLRVCLRSSLYLHRQQRGQATVRTVQETYDPPAFQGNRNLAHEHAKPPSTHRVPQWHATALPIAGESVEVSSIYLRDRCTCKHCVDPFSKQRSFLTTDIPEDIQGKVVALEAGAVTIRWTNDIEGFGSEHLTTIPASTLRELFDVYAHTPVRPVEWTAADFEGDCKDITFDEYLQSDAKLDQVLRQLRKYGLAFISNVPESEECVAKIAERVGPVKNTLYGYTWDVRSVPDATNVAYTSKDLGFHMDLLPMALVPQLQFLHCIRSSAKGGNSLFTDAYTAAQQLWREDPNAFLDLCDIPVIFHYDHPESHLYRRISPVLDVHFAEKGQDRLTEYGSNIPINRIFWSPPFQGPFEYPRKLSPAGVDLSTGADVWAFGNSIARWRSAAAKFNALIHQQANIHQRLMKPGECVIFVNNRVLHARTAFEVDDAGKERWLRGCYVDSDVWLSKEKVLERKLRQ